MNTTDCKNCPYRIILARFDLHICYLDCDKAGTEEFDTYKNYLKRNQNDILLYIL